MSIVFGSSAVLSSQGAEDIAEECYLTDLVKQTEEMVEMSNDLCMEEAGEKHQMDLEQVRKDAGKNLTREMTYLVDRARAEALDALGEYRAARETAARYLLKARWAREALFQ
jgi:hypothetical protein